MGMIPSGAVDVFTSAPVFWGGLAVVAVLWLASRAGVERTVGSVRALFDGSAIMLTLAGFLVGILLGYIFGVDGLVSTVAGVLPLW